MCLHTTIPSFFYYSSDSAQIALKMRAIFIAEVTPGYDGFSLQLRCSSKKLINTLQSALSGLLPSALQVTTIHHTNTIMPLRFQTKFDRLVRCKMRHAEKDTEAV
jgi:hypothetical protein